MPSLLAPMGAARPPPVERNYDLQRAKDGSGELVYEASGFTAHVERDGNVHFRDKHFSVTKINLLPWAPSRTPQGTPTLQGLLAGLNARNRAPLHPHRPYDPRDVPDQPPTPIARMSPYRPDPSEACHYPQACFFQPDATLINVSGTFDLTDELMRLEAQDPYRYEKARFLGATRDLRTRLAVRAHAEDIHRAVTDLPLTLEAIACDDRLPVGERRAILEGLRAEMDGAAPGAPDAVARITRFIAARFDGADGGVTCPAQTAGR